MRGSRKDQQRLREIAQRLTQPFEDEDLELEDKLWYAFAPLDYPIYRRKILKRMPVQGLWWMNETQWVKFMWQGHNDAQIIKSGEDDDKVLATRSFEPGGWCYIRYTYDNRIDLEAMSRTTGWDSVKKKKVGTIREWMAVSVTKENYKTLDNFMGPPDDICKHNKKIDSLFE